MSDTLTQISPADPRARRQVDALLAREGIRRDRHLDYLCGVFDEDWELVAAGGCFANTLRSLAVDSRRRGEGLLGRVAGHLLEVQAQRGNGHVFLCTKPQTARYFGELGFYEIARAEGSLVFMENRRRGFADYCAALSGTRREGDAAAIVLHANPFTLGHLHLTERAAAESGTVHLFVLSEELGPIPFAVRKKLVREGTAHLPNVVCHDSGPYIISTAAFPGYFLPEGDAAIRAQAALDLGVFGSIARSLGVTRRYAGEEPASRVTALYNETMARRLPELGVEFRVLPRLAREGRAVSASDFRQAVHDGRLEDALALLPESGRRYFSGPEAAPVLAALRAAEHVVHY